MFRNIPSGTLRPLPSGGSKRPSLLIKTVTLVVATFREMASATSSISHESEGSLSCDGSFCRFLDLVLGPENRKRLGGRLRPGGLPV